MDTELLFCILFLVLFFGGLAIRGYARKRQPGLQRSVRERIREAIKVEGKANFILLVFNGVYLIIATVLYLFFVSWMPWSQLPLPEWLRWIGFGAGIISLPFNFWVHHTLGKHWFPSLELKEQHTLVTSGPYSRIRHPMYTVHIVYFFALFLVSANLHFLIVFILTIIMIFVRMPREEQMMLDRFGDEYRAYMKRTGRLLPRFRRGADE